MYLQMTFWDLPITRSVSLWLPVGLLHDTMVMILLLNVWPPVQPYL